jgi:hypothetical protein
MENTIIEVIAILFGFLIRLGIPIGLTFLFSLYLKWLDRRWEAEAEARTAAEIAQAEESLAYKKPCWEIQNCPSKTRDACPAYAQPQKPCWETFRVNGKFQPACYNCKVLPATLSGLGIAR